MRTLIALFAAGCLAGPVLADTDCEQATAEKLHGVAHDGTGD